MWYTLKGSKFWIVGVFVFFLLSNSYHLWNIDSLVGALCMLSSDAHKSSESQVISPKSRRGCTVGKEQGRARISAASLTPYFPTHCSVKHFWELLLVKSQSWVPESRFRNPSMSFPLEGACHSHHCVKVSEKPGVKVFHSISLSYPKYILGTWNSSFSRNVW